MTSSDPHTEPAQSSRRGAIKPWLSLAIVCVFAAGATLADRSLKRDTLNGYVPAGAGIAISLNDLGASWRSLEATAYWKDVQEDEGDLLRDPLVELRKTTGIRLTSERWNTWLGPHAVLGIADTGWGICTRPGVLMRGVHAWNRIFGQAPRDGVWAFRGWYYGWRGSYFVLAPNANYVHDVLSAHAVAVDSNDSNVAVGLVIAANSPRPRYTLQIEPQGDFSVTGRVDYAFTPVSTNGSFARLATDSALVSISGARLAETGAYVASFLPNWRNLDEIRWELSHAHEIGWSSGAAPEAHVLNSTLVVRDVDTSTFLAAPSLYTRSTLMDSAAIDTSIPSGATASSWGGKGGWIALRKGTQMMSLAAWDDRAWHTANNTLAMDAYINEPGKPSSLPSDIRVSLDWKRLAGYAEQIMLDAADAELLPGMNRRDAEDRRARILPWFRHLGKLECSGVVIGHRLRFQGALNARTPEDASHE